MTLTTSNETLLDYDGTEHWVESTATEFAGASDFVIEAVAVYVTIKHPHRGDLRIELERNGVASLLTDDKLEHGTSYTHHKYTTLRHWGERDEDGADGCHRRRRRDRDDQARRRRDEVREPSVVGSNFGRNERECRAHDGDAGFSRHAGGVEGGGEQEIVR
mgnify:CR=1 FL=1